MIHFKEVSKHYNTFQVLNNISFGIKQGEFVSLVGPSGAGKSTLIKLLTREENVTEGQIFFGDTDITRLPQRELPILRRRIGTIFQDFKLLADRTVFENVAFALEVAGSPEERIYQDVPRVLKIVGLADKTDRFPVELSGGEKQRVAAARALIHRPDIIAADEPTGNLDPLNTWEIIRLLIKINEMGTTVILATHDKEIINALKQRVITLKDGKIVRDEEKGRYIM